MNKLITASFLSILGVLLVNPSLVNAQLAITEVMPDTASSQDASEWLEIFNYSPFSIPLADIKINSKTLISELVELPSNNYLVITKNRQSFTTEFGSLDNLAEAGISLSNSGTSLDLTLKDNPADTITYSQVQALKSWQRSGFLCNEYIWQLPTIASQNINYVEDCNLVETIESGLSMELDSLIEELKVTDEIIKLFGFSIENNFIYGNKINNYFPPFQITGYYFDNHKLYKTAPLNIFTTTSLRSASSSTASTSASSSHSSTSISSSSSLSSTTSSVSSQSVVPKLEISEVYAAPVSPDKEWLEIYNFGQDINLGNCEIKDNVGRHKLIGDILANTFLQVSDLKISLNNGGELLEIYCNGQLIDSWQQPAVKSGETTMRKFTQTRHVPEIFITLQPTPGKENELVLPAISSGNSSVSSTSKTSVATVKNSQSLTQSNADGIAIPATVPRFSINNRLPIISSEYEREVIIIKMALVIATSVEIILICLAISRISNVRKLVKKLVIYIKHQLNNWLEIKDQKSRLQSLRY